MPDQEDIARQQTLLDAHRRTLHHLIVQAAQYGGVVLAPPQTANGIYEARAQIRQLKAALRGWGVAVEDVPGDEQDAPDPEAIARQAGAALSAVATLMSTPDVRAQMAAFQESFGSALKQLDLLITYKALHDLLHDLQFKCYRPIVSDTAGFPGSELVRDSLNYDLPDIVSSLHELAERPEFPAQERAWIAQVDQAAKRLSAALDEANKPQFDRATFEIARVLYVCPTRINERLKEAARHLPLDRLIRAMAAVRDHLAHSAADRDRTEQVGQGIGALEQIRDRLGQLIQEHDTWQMFDAQLQHFEEQPDQHQQELAWLWEELKPAVVALCAARSDRRSSDLRQATERLDHAISGQASGALASLFRSFYSRFSLCFFYADKELKEQCLKLRLVDGPLRSVIGMLG